jgi:predicted GNAT family acetyltransferase
MDIQRDEHGKNGAFFIDQDGEWVAELAYTRSSNGEITITHTEVDESLQGQGVGEQLVKAVVDYARENGLKVVAECKYAKKVIDETPDYQDVLAA